MLLQLDTGATFTQYSNGGVPGPKAKCVKIRLARELGVVAVFLVAKDRGSIVDLGCPAMLVVWFAAMCRCFRFIL